MLDCFLPTCQEKKSRACLINLKETDFARTGSIATEKVELLEGPLDQFTHEMEPFLRKQGMPVRLNKGVVELVSDFVVCEEGKPLSPESARILVSGIHLGSFGGQYQYMLLVMLFRFEMSVGNGYMFDMDILNFFKFFYIFGGSYLYTHVQKCVEHEYQTRIH